MYLLLFIFSFLEDSKIMIPKKKKKNVWKKFPFPLIQIEIIPYLDLQWGLFFLLQKR